MKKLAKFAVILPAAALVIQFVLLPQLTQRTRMDARSFWEGINGPVHLLIWIFYPITEQLSLNWGVNLDYQLRNVGIVLLWFVVGLLIDRKKDGSPTKESTSYKFTAWDKFTLVLVSGFGVFFVWLWCQLIKFQYESFQFNAHPARTIVWDLAPAAWTFALGAFAIRNFPLLSRFLKRLLHSRPEASWMGYLPLVVVPPLILSEPYEMIVLPALGLIQIKYRTFAGWLLLMVWSLRYTALASITYGLIRNSYNLIFLAFGLIASAALLVWRPRFRTA